MARNNSGRRGRTGTGSGASTAISQQQHANSGRTLPHEPSPPLEYSPDETSLVHMLFFYATVTFVHAYNLPFTKVEESFNLQATHDILVHGNNIEKYDHLEFPGVVPRSFLGPLTLAGISLPFTIVAQLMELPKFILQYIVRFSLAFCVSYGLARFNHAVQTAFGTWVSAWLMYITVSQFHLMFYSSRTLPNIFALAVVLLALAAWLEEEYDSFIFCSAAAVIVFRAELVMLVGPIALWELAEGKLGFKRFFILGFLSGVLCLSLSVFVDSYFWQRTLWPEGEVLHFNVIQNKSSEWGTQPLEWYVKSALPRMLGGFILLIPIAHSYDYDGKVAKIAIPTILFVAAYSLLPHKELRFIIYTVPLFNTMAAVTASNWSRDAMTYYLAPTDRDRPPSPTLDQYITGLVASGLIGVNLILTCFFAYASMHNYPGGAALLNFQQSNSHMRNVNMHWDVYTCQTGGTRFLEMYDHWKYNKTENLTAKQKFDLGFTHLFIEAEALEKHQDYFQLLESVSSYSGMGYDLKTLPPEVEFNFDAAIHIMERRKKPRKKVVTKSTAKSRKS